MNDEIEIMVRIWPGAGSPRPSPHGPDVEGRIRKPLLASLLEDNEENAVRMAEQMIREAFRRKRGHTHAIIKTQMAEPDGRTVFVVRFVRDLDPFDVAVFFGGLEACSVEVVRRNNPRAFQDK